MGGCGRCGSPKNDAESSMPKSKPHIAIVGGGIGGLFAANALLAHGLKRLGLRAGPGARRDRRRRLPHAERGAPSASASASAPPRRNTARWSARSRTTSATTATPIAPVQVADAVGLERDLRHAPRRPRRFPRRQSAGAASSTAATAPPASRRAATPPASPSPTAPPSRPTSSSPPTASTPSFAPTSSRRRSRCSTAPSPTAASFRASACRTGRWTAG